MEPLRLRMTACLRARHRDHDFGVASAFVAAFGAAAIVGLSGRVVDAAVPLPNDKLLHGLMFGTIGLAFALALYHLRGTPVLVRTVIAVVSLTLFGVTDEWHQSFVGGRVADVWDVVADGLGALVFCGAAAFAARTTRRGADPTDRAAPGQRSTTHAVAASPVAAAAPPPNLPRR